MAGMKFEALLAARQAEQRRWIEIELLRILDRLGRLKVREKELEARVAQLEERGEPPRTSA